MSLPVLVKKLCKSWDDKTVLDDINLALAPGSITALLGPNGAGKTTFIGCLLGLLAPSSGSVALWGQPADALSDETRQRIGFVPQLMTGLTWFRVQELKDYTASFRNSAGTSLHSAVTSQEAKQWEDWADLDPKARLSTLSGGERQRLAIVLALRFSPELIVLDEPVASLDPMARHDFITLLAQTVKRHETTALISSHIISDLEQICDRFIVFKKGHLINDLSAESFASEIRYLASRPVSELGLHVMADLPDGSVWVKGWHPKLDGIGLPVLPGDMESCFLALTR
ncbi:ABC transporter ATP-binding protein [Asaia sp. W19]|uniref:ABC transporter ATP-binding protein n=1 Tax=unclassified Asaia TaxID=2685023 RepID=UPI000F8F6D83|nr:ABC transporter ATP-binding protein [Asaia sp. W19]RUT27109.1 ABC transporter ATP-binding protein [Asaia sp. W19]